MPSKKQNDIIRQLADWIQDLKFNPKTRQWECRLKPDKILIFSEIEDIIIALEQHVVNELIEISAEALRVNAEGIKYRSREREYADLRSVVANLVIKHFWTIRQSSIASILGWRNRCTFVAANLRSEVKEVKDKIEKVYRAYPSLREGRVEIVSNEIAV